jgi:hypothetical protein
MKWISRIDNSPNSVGADIAMNRRGGATGSSGRDIRARVVSGWNRARAARVFGHFGLNGSAGHLGESPLLQHALSFRSKGFPGLGHFQQLSPVLVSLGVSRKRPAFQGVMSVFTRFFHESSFPIPTSYNSDRSNGFHDSVKSSSVQGHECNRPFRDGKGG